MSIIECRNISAAYDGIKPLSDVTFSIEDKDYLCIIGDNGTGKTTLMKVILGLKHQSSGEIIFNNLSKNQIGYLAQQSELQKEFPASVKEVVLSGCVNRKRFNPFYTKSDKEKAKNAMQTLDILKLKDRCYRELSGGQQQRVLLARAICASDKILFMDEPTTGLDPIMTTEFFNLTEKMNRELGIAIVMVTHDTHCAVKYSKNILCLYKENYFYGKTSDFISTDKGKLYMGGHKHD